MTTTSMELIHSRFRDHFTRTTSTEFQRFVEDLLKMTIQGFQRIASGGGDKGLDGSVYADCTITTAYQIYAPEVDVTDSMIIRKAEKDFGKASENWETLKKWIFIYRHRTRRPEIRVGVSEEIRAMGKGLNIVTEILSEDELWNMFKGLSNDEQVSLLGSADIRRIHRWESPVLKANVSVTTRRILLDQVDSTVNDQRLTKWEDTVLLIMKLMKAELALLPDKIEDSRSRDKEIENLDTLIRETLMFLLTSASKQRDWRKASVVIKGIDTCLKFLSEVEKEEYFANWIGDLRGFYFDHVQAIIENSPTKKSFDPDLYEFVQNFARILVRPIEEAVNTGGGTFSLEFGAEVLFAILSDRMHQVREFHTSEDDFTNPLSISVMIPQILFSVSNMIESILSYPESDTGVTKFWNMIEEIIFSLLVILRDRGELTSLHYSGAMHIMNYPAFVKVFIERNHLQELLDYEKAERFDSIVELIQNSLKKWKESFRSWDVVRIFQNSLAIFPKQRRIYGRVADSLFDLCLDCITVLENEFRIKSAIELTETACNTESDSSSDFFHVRVFQMLGWVANEEKHEKDVVDYVENSFLKRKMINRGVIARLKEISEYSIPPQNEETQYLSPLPLYDKVEIERSKMALELIEKISKANT